MSTILVLDDQAANRQFLTTLLGYVGHRVLEAPDAQAALKMVSEERPQLVIADVVLPGIDGYEFARRVRATPAVASTPIVFFSSGDGDAKSAAAAKACGARHVLQKPADPQTILNVVSEVLGGGAAPAGAAEAFEREFVGGRPEAIDPAATVFLVEDNTEQRNDAVAILRGAAVPVNAFESAEQFLKTFKRDAPGCIIVDLRMPGMSGLELLDELRAQQINIPALVLSGHGDIPAAVHSMKLGVLDFLEKPVNPQILVSKVYEALVQNAEQRKKQGETDAVRQRFANLTPREHELLQLLIAGKSNKQVAAVLGISIKTVAHHRSHLMEKTQALNAADLVRLSLIAGIEKPAPDS